MKSKNLFAAGIAAVMFILTGSANADLILTEGAAGTGINVVFGEEVGTPEGDNGSILLADLSNGEVDAITFFSVTDQLTSTPSGNGQCCLNAADGNLNDVAISLTDLTVGFAELIFNLQSNDGLAVDVIISATDQFGVVFNFGSFALGNGQNFFTLTTALGQVATELRIQGDDGFGMRDMQQVRLGSADLDDPPVGVPEPGTLGLLGLGLLGLGLRRRSKV